MRFHANSDTCLTSGSLISLLFHTCRARLLKRAVLPVTHRPAYNASTRNSYVLFGKGLTSCPRSSTGKNLHVAAAVPFSFFLLLFSSSSSPAGRHCPITSKHSGSLLSATKKSSRKLLASNGSHSPSSPARPSSWCTAGSSPYAACTKTICQVAAPSSSEASPFDCPSSASSDSWLFLSRSSSR